MIGTVDIPPAEVCLLERDPLMPTRVQRTIDERGALVFPGVYDTLSAQIAEPAPRVALHTR